VTCTYPPCGRDAKARGLCMGHYRQQNRGNPLRPLLAPRGRQGKGKRTGRSPPPPCTFTGCNRPDNGKGLCASHRYQKKQGRQLVPIGAAKRWWWPVEARGGDA
jgi:hypothetical protein